MEKERKKLIKWTPKIFIEKARAIHGNKYDYSKVENFRVMNDKVTIICPIHKEFRTTVCRHLLGNDCRICGWLKTRVTLEEFITRAESFFGMKYDYSLVKFNSVVDKISVICPTHGIFKLRAQDMLKGIGCAKCGWANITLTQEEVITRFTDIHGSRYNYSNVLYKNNYTKVDIICSKHGLFSQMPYDHMRGNGCSKCRASHGERLLSLYLSRNNIPFIQEYKIDGYHYRYDFYLPDINLLIEYDGLSHYEENPVYKKGWLKYTKRLDKAKNSLAKEHGINLLRIKYTDYKNIHKVVSEYINKMYPYRYNNIFYKSEEEILKNNTIEANAIAYIVNKHKTKKQLTDLVFSVSLKANL